MICALLITIRSILNRPNFVSYYERLWIVVRALMGAYGERICNWLRLYYAYRHISFSVDAFCVSGLCFLGRNEQTNDFNEQRRAKECERNFIDYVNCDGSALDIYIFLFLTFSLFFNRFMAHVSFFNSFQGMVRHGTVRPIDRHVSLSIFINCR